MTIPLLHLRRKAEVRRFLVQRWFLISLVLVLTLGISAPGPVQDVAGWIPPRAAVAAVLFLMAVSLDSSRLWNAFRTPWPALLAIAINSGVLPLMAWGVSRLQATPDFAIGMIVAGAVPCTLASAVVWTRKAGGDDAVALLVTMTTNLACFLVTPLWLVATTGRAVELDVFDLMVRLAALVLTPTLLGQVLRLSQPVARFATRWKTAIGVAGQAIILTIVLIGASRVGFHLRELDGGLVWLDFLWVIAGCVAVHVGALGLGVSTARGLGFALPQQAAVAFASSQKTLPIGLLLTTSAAYFGEDYPMSVLPMVVYHVMQLVIDTFVAGRFARQAEIAEVEATVVELAD